MLENGLDYCTCKRRAVKGLGNAPSAMEYHTTKSRRFPQPYCKRNKTEKRFIKKTTADLKGESK